MASVALSIALFAGAAAAQSSTVGFAPTPLDNVVYPRPSDAPYQVFGFNGHDIYTRGYQSGYNICNSTTEGANSLCQTMVQNSIMDFCLWAPTTMSSIGDAEGEVVAYCSQPGHGTRLIPEGAITGMQLLFDGEAYMMTGTLDQTKLNVMAGDYGGELDSGGQDGRGNPIGGLLYSTTFSPDSNLYQVRHWTEFIGSDGFCFKWCKDTGSNPDGKCQHTLDRIGTSYNCPSKYTLGAPPADGLFEVCDSASFPVPGVYTDAAGATQSYAQPPESLGAISTMPYQPSSAATSNCKTYASSDVFAAVATVSAPSAGTTSGAASGSGSTSSGFATSTAGSTASTKAPGSNSKATSAPAAPTTSTGANGSSNSTGGASGGNSGAGETFPGVSLFATVAGVLAAISVFA